jgi:hypothetical protein
VRRRGGAGEIVDAVDVGARFQRLADVVLHNRELRMVANGAEIVAAAGQEAVDADDAVALVEQRFAEMRPQKTGAAGHDDCFGLPGTGH